MSYTSNIAAVHVLPLAPIAVRYPDSLWRVRNDQRTLLVNLAGDDRLLYNLTTRAEHQLSSEFHQQRSGHMVKAIEQGMKTIAHDKEKRMVRRENDVALVMTEF